MEEGGPKKLFFKFSHGWELPTGEIFYQAIEGRLANCRIQRRLRNEVDRAPFRAGLNRRHNDMPAQLGCGTVKAGPKGCNQALGTEAIEHGIGRAPTGWVGAHRVCPPESRRSAAVSAPCSLAALVRFRSTDVSFLFSCMRGGCGFDPTPRVRSRSQDSHSGDVMVTMLGALRQAESRRSSIRSKLCR